MYDSETSELLQKLAEVTTTLGAAKLDRNAINARILDIEQKIARRNFSAGGGGGPIEKSWGQSLIESDEFKALAAAPSQRGKASVQVKTIQTLTATVGGQGLVAPDIITTPVMLPKRVMTIRALLAPGVTGSNAVYYPRQTTRTNLAATVSEGALKPQSEVDFAQIIAPVSTIATFVLASRQILDDAPALQSVIDGELRYMIDFAEEVQLLFGDGTGSNLNGLVPNSTAFAAPYANPSLFQNADVLLQAIAQVAQSLFQATGIILNVVDWIQMMSLKTTIGNYLLGGPTDDAYRLLWSIPIVPTLAMPAGQFLVGAFGIAAQIFDRMEAEILASTEDADNFRKNLVTLRAEKRLALAIKRPAALVYGTFP